MHERVAMRYYPNVLGVTPEGRRPLLSEETMTAALEANAAPSVGEGQAANAPLILPAPAARALGILATSPLPFPQDAYHQLFPDIDWKAPVPTLIAAKAVTGDPSSLQVAKSTKDSFLPSPADNLPYIDAWVAALEPLREHVDMAVLLSLQHLARQEHSKAADVLLGIAPALSAGFGTISMRASFRPSVSRHSSTAFPRSSAGRSSLHMASALPAAGRR